MRAKVNLTLERDTIEAAREMGLNMSRIAEATLTEAVQADRNSRWVEERRAILDAYERQIEADDCALERFRRF